MNDKNIHPSHVIYKGTCICEQTYIGETARNLEVRVNEHSDVQMTVGICQVHNETPRSQVRVGRFNHHSFMDE